MKEKQRKLRRGETHNSGAQSLDPPFEPADPSEYEFGGVRAFKKSFKNALLGKNMNKESKGTFTRRDEDNVPTLRSKTTQDLARRPLPSVSPLQEQKNEYEPHRSSEIQYSNHAQSHTSYTTISRQSIAYQSTVFDDTPRSLESTTAQAGGNSVNDFNEFDTVLTKNPFAEHGNSSQLSRIKESIIGLSNDYTELQGLESGTAEAAVSRLVGEYGVIGRCLKDANKSVNDLHAKLGKFRSLELDYHAVENDLRATKTVLTDQEKLISDMQGKLSIERYNHGFKVEQLERKISLLQSENDAFVAKHDKQTAVERENFQRDYSRLKGTYESQLQKLQDDTTMKMKAMGEYHQQSIDTLSASLLTEQAQVRRLEEFAEDQIREATMELRSRLDESNEAYKYVKQELEEEQLRQRKELQKQKKQLTEEHQAESYRLRSAAEELKLAFVAREHFKGLRDRDLAGKFTKLATEVEDLSTLEWDSLRSAEWPLSEHHLMQIHPKNVRILKQQIIQNSLWILLYKHVFQSPFAIMGREAHAQNEEWQFIYNSDNSPFDWPEVSAANEKQRHEDAQFFLSAIYPSTKTSADARRLKGSFEYAVSDTLGNIHRALERVIRLESKDRKILDGMVRLCAKIWLECCSQRYRLLVSMPDRKDDYLMSPRREVRSLKLVVRPDLKRYGNSQGEELSSGESITGWQGLVENYPKR